MTCLPMTVFYGSLALLALSAAPAPQKGIDPATVAAYEEIGGIYGGFSATPDDFGSYFHAGRDYAENGLPGFRFLAFPATALPKVGVPFGLDLSQSYPPNEKPRVTDTELKKLVGLNNLTSLHMRQTGVTDKGLKDLAGFKN